MTPPTTTTLMLPTIDTSQVSRNQDSRVLFLILHFTDETFEDSMRILTTGNVSSHYLLSEGPPARIYRLVDESQRAWHAGDSAWGNHALLNSSSIGIEIVNLGPRPQADNRVAYTPYPKEQIDTLILLIKDIVARHKILPSRILGHSDIAPQRKVDPGPEFPWKRLADEGLIPWPDAALVAAKRAEFDAALPDAAWFQRMLAKHGYRTPQTGVYDEATRKVIAAFQMKYRPARYDGMADAESAALLDVLVRMATP